MQEWYKNVTEEDLTESHKKFLGILSIPEILELCDMFGGANTYIPMNDEVFNRVVRDRAIRDAYRNGEKVSKLATAYRISESSITRIVRIR